MEQSPIEPAVDINYGQFKHLAASDHISVSKLVDNGAS